MAMLIQSLSAQAGHRLPDATWPSSAVSTSQAMVIFMWVLMEIVAMATDLAEFLGAALGFYLLFGMPLG